VALKSPRGEEAAAIAAALARFEAEHQAAPLSAATDVGAWQRAALLEGVGAKQIIRDAQGGTTWQS
jgi:hypothetical protein